MSKIFDSLYNVIIFILFIICSMYQEYNDLNFELVLLDTLMIRFYASL